MKKQIRKPICFVVSSPSAAGKTTLVENVLRRAKDLHKTVSHTTRSSRPGEKNKVHYHFVNGKKFNRMVVAGQMLEWANVYENSYGTSKKEIERIFKKGSDVILVIENKGAKAIKKIFPRSVFILILPPSLAELKKRIMKRQHGGEDVKKRLENARTEIRNLCWFDYVIVNKNLQTSVRELLDIISAERLRLEPVCSKLMKDFLR